MMTMNDKYAGYINMEVTEVVLTRVTWDITHEMMEAHECTTLEEFERKVHSGDIDLFDYDYVEMDTVDSEIDQIHPETAQAERFPNV